MIRKKQGCRNIFDGAKDVPGAAKHAVLGFGRGLVARLGAAQLPIRVNTLAPSWTESNILPSLKSLLDEISVKVQPASVVARCAAYLMADPSRNGQVIHIQHGIYTKIDETFLLPTYRRINRDCITEDEALERLEEAEVYRMVRVQPQLVRFAASKF
ncbi:hypothetical protein BFJ63_vAg16197 [Fusarium oxysporum f. sp. narcissi]|uniref:Uncharacterized protein n=1 Tax=Fusarium oxysporum f. sp. narcissi TaxID=451672 RepID=A0A4Q2V1V6_FUSOX|nr:hypothetical protein FocnCong_v011701 [Fusarium oxysporum f. sp. conglutinans]RYC80915.1 hypothetical protein BFJ63_vAg16197 [Fusarium oxysporum f. sp. narcissi]